MGLFAGRSLALFIVEDAFYDVSGSAFGLNLFENDGDR